MVAIKYSPPVLMENGFDHKLLFRSEIAKQKSVEPLMSVEYNE